MSTTTPTAAVQAQKFSAQIASARLSAFAAVIVIGARYRTLRPERKDDLEGTGSYYSAIKIETRASANRTVAVVGGAKCAGRAALPHYGQRSEVTPVARGCDLGNSMLAYLTDRIDDHPSVRVRSDSGTAELRGDTRLQAAVVPTAGDSIRAAQE